MFKSERIRQSATLKLLPLLALAAPAFAPAAHAATLGPVITINSSPDGAARQARSPGGLSVVSWQQVDSQGNTTRLVAQTFKADGSPASAVFQVGPSLAAGPMLNDTVTINDAGNVTATYWKNTAFWDSLYVQRFNLDGTTVGSPILVYGQSAIGSTGTKPEWLRSAMDASGNFVVAWTDLTTTGSSPCTGVCPPWHQDYSNQSSKTYARSYTSAGAAVGPATVVDSVATQHYPYSKGYIENADLLESLSMTSTGDIVMLLGVCRQPTDYTIYDHCDNLSGDHTLKALRLHLNLTQAANPQSLTLPEGLSLQKAADAAGNVDIESANPNAQYVLARYAANGTALGTSAPFGSDSNIGLHNSLAVAANGSAVVTWTALDSETRTIHSIYGQYFDGSGRASGGNFLIDNDGGLGADYDVPALDNSGRLFEIYFDSLGMVGRIVTLP